MAEDNKYISKVKIHDEAYLIKDQEVREELQELLTETIIFDCGTSTTVIDTISE